MKIRPSQRRAITDLVEKLYEDAKVRLLGRFFKGPQIWFELNRTSDPTTSLEGLYRYSLAMMYGTGAPTNDDTLAAIAEITGNYLDAEKAKTVNKVLAGVAQAESPEEVRNTLESVMESASSKMEELIVTETKNASNMAEREGILQVASGLGLEDPTVARLGPVDAKTCKTCLKLWHDDTNPMIPKVYKSSEIRDGYTNHKDPFPTWLATHPHCRHTWILVAPNYGFDSKGRMVFVGFGHDEHAARANAVEKKESVEISWVPCLDHDHG